MKRVPRNVVTVNGSILFIFLVAEENLVRTVTGRQINVPAAQTVTHFFGLISYFTLDGDDDKEVERFPAPAVKETFL